jgi:hypothetical protein
MKIVRHIIESDGWDNIAIRGRDINWTLESCLRQSYILEIDWGHETIARALQRISQLIKSDEDRHEDE